MTASFWWMLFFLSTSSCTSLPSSSWPSTASSATSATRSVFQMSAGGSNHQATTTTTTSSSSSNNGGIKVLGVCGGIGSGKSMACQLLVSDLGCIAHIGTYVHPSTSSKRAKKQYHMFHEICIVPSHFFLIYFLRTQNPKNY